jgi:hypothetical protein
MKYLGYNLIHFVVNSLQDELPETITRGSLVFWAASRTTTKYRR